MSWQVKSAMPPEGYGYGGRYVASVTNITRAIAHILRGRPRSLARDALLAIFDMPMPPVIRDAHLLPRHGPYVVVANHYERPGLWMAWSALLVSHAVRERTTQDTHWIAIEEWESFSLWGIPISSSMIRPVFERAFSTYGILAMPPPAASTSARAGVMRSALTLIKRGEIIGLMPEGDVGPTPELLEAREGVGSFLLLLAAGHAKIVPAGLYEEDDRLVARFGATVDLDLPVGLPKGTRDTWARDRVMLAIKELLPQPLWGYYKNTDRGTVIRAPV